MRNLLNFIIRFSTWFVFAFFALISLMLLFFNNRYQNSVWLTSSNAFSSTLYGWSNGVTGYFNLKDINKALQERNAYLENEVLNMRMEIANYQSMLKDTILTESNRYDYILATVLHNSVRHPQNYFTINKGLKDGVVPGMGVVDQNGIVGIVNVAGDNNSRVISLLNSTQRFSVKLKGTEYVGTLSWRGTDPTIGFVEEIPRHALFAIGDTIVTSGFSTTFPGNLPVGVVMGRTKAPDDNFYILKIRLTSDFKHLTSVRVLKDEYKSELDSLAKFDIIEE